jgi:hypothetical protein
MNVIRPYSLSLFSTLSVKEITLDTTVAMRGCCDSLAIRLNQLFKMVSHTITATRWRYIHVWQLRYGYDSAHCVFHTVEGGVTHGIYIHGSACKANEEVRILPRHFGAILHAQVFVTYELHRENSNSLYNEDPRLVICQYDAALHRVWIFNITVLGTSDISLCNNCSHFN